MTKSQKWIISRRHFLKSTASLTAGMMAGVFTSKPELLAADDQSANAVVAKAVDSAFPKSQTGPAEIGAAAQTSDPSDRLHFGLVTDSHYADIDVRGNRHYRASLDKMTECIELMNDKNVDFLVHLGDFKNGAPENNFENLKLIESCYAGFNGPRYHVLGNHDLDQLSKKEFQSHVANTNIDREHTYYSFMMRDVHFVVLDANFRSDGTPYNSGNFNWTDTYIPERQLEWLDQELKHADGPSVIFVHQLLDNDEGDYRIRNASTVRRILEKYPGVIAVFQGHQHQGQYKRINGIHYYTLKAMVEGPEAEDNSYAIVRVLGDLSLEVTGYRKAVSIAAVPRGFFQEVK